MAGRPPRLPLQLGVPGNAEAANVGWHQGPGLQVLGGLGSLLRRHVDVRPTRVVLPHVQGDQCLADFALQRDDRVVIEVVPVIVGDQQ
jgi:hypothetical protein